MGDPARNELTAEEIQQERNLRRTNVGIIDATNQDIARRIRVVGEMPAATPVGAGPVRIGPVNIRGSVAPPQPPADPGAAAAMRQYSLADQELSRRGVYTGPPTRTERVITQQGPVDPETRAAMSQADLDARAALKNQAVNTSDNLQQQGSTFDTAEQQSQQEAARVNQAAEAQAQAMQMQTQRADAINQQVLTGKVDPNRILGDSLSSGRFAAAIGMMIAGMAQGQQGADAFLNTINQTIDRDIAAQEANMANTRAAAQGQQNLVSQYRSVFNDENAAREAARATMLQSISQKLQAQQARLGATGQFPNLQLALAQLDAQSSAASAAAQQAAGRTTVTQNERSGGMVGGPNLRVAAARTGLGTAIGTEGDRVVDNNREGMAAQATATANNPDLQRLAYVGHSPRYRVIPGREGLPLPSNQTTMAHSAQVAQMGEDLLGIQRDALVQREILTRGGLTGRLRETSGVPSAEYAAARDRLEVLRMRAGQVYGALSDAGAQGNVEADRYMEGTGVNNENSPVRSWMRGEDVDAIGLRASMDLNDRRVRQLYDTLGIERVNDPGRPPAHEAAGIQPIQRAP